MALGWMFSLATSVTTYNDWRIALHADNYRENEFLIESVSYGRRHNKSVRYPHATGKVDGKEATLSLWDFNPGLGSQQEAEACFPPGTVLRIWHDPTAANIRTQGRFLRFLPYDFDLDTAAQRAVRGTLVCHGLTLVTSLLYLLSRFRHCQTLLPVLALVMGFVCPACGKRETPVHIAEVVGTPAERSAKVEAFLLRHAPALPGPISDAHLLEERTGDGNLGPSDFSCFVAFTVPLHDLERWTATFAPLESHNHPVRFSSPGNTSCPWWIKSHRFTRLKFHSPRSLAGRDHGWIGVDDAAGRIFLHVFTM
jgi:hypothetical protein